MRKLLRSAIVGLFVGLLSTAPVRAAAVTDCPLRDTPFSLASPLVDILLNPKAKAAVEAELPGAFKALPPPFLSTQAPTFASILTLKEMAGMARLPQDKLAAADAAVRKVPVTRADRIARCARYDNDRPQFTLPSGKPRILLFEKMTGYRDGPSVEAARAAFEAMAQRNGWALVVTDKGGAMTPSILRQFDAVIWNNVSGDVLTLSQRKAFKDYIERGGSFIGVHGSAGDPVTFWDWYVDTLIGARFAGHPMNPQFQDARVVVEAHGKPLGQGLPAEWVMKDEWYSFKNNPRATGATVIATLDEKTYSPKGFGQELRMGDDHPIAWTRCVGKGRMFYAAIGHRPESYSQPYYVTMLENAVRWAGAKQEPCRSR